MQPYIGEIRAFGFQRAPRGWFPCDGRLLPLAQYSALYYLLGTTYGGDGQTSFGLPDLRGRLINGSSTEFPDDNFGAATGSEAVVMTMNAMPQHSHTLYTPQTENPMVSLGDGTQPNPDATHGVLGIPVDAQLGQQNLLYNGEVPDVALNIGAPAVALGTTGTGAPISVMQRFTVVNFCICCDPGLFPTLGN